MAPQPRQLDGDVIYEILLRLPPDEPQCLFRAALVCKPWLRTLSDPAFLRRYRGLHGAPPLLGFIVRDSIFDENRLVPTMAVPAFPLPGLEARSGWPFDCRHGRVLVRKLDDRSVRYLVCDPVTGVCHPLPLTGIGVGTGAGTGSTCETTAAVYCAAVGCEHLDCSGGPFCVIVIASNYSTDAVSATVYSSETGVWSAPATLEGVSDRDAYGRGALVGDGIYFLLSGYTGILMGTGIADTGIVKYDLGENCLSAVEPPQSLALYVYDNRIILTVMEDASLGLAAIEDCNLYLWSRRVSSEGTAEWVPCTVIDLDTMMPMANPRDRASVVCFPEGVGVIFVSTNVGLFMMELKSGRVRKVHEPGLHHLSVLPYISFYTPDRLLGRPADL